MPRGDNSKVDMESVKITIPRYLLNRINALRKDLGNRREPQGKCIHRIVEFYEKNNPLNS